MWAAMSAVEREEFLAGVHVGVLSAAVGTAGQTLAVPVWYSYQPGGLLTVLTGRRSRKAAAIRAAGRFGLCAQDDSPPYRYVSAEGPVVSEEELDRAERLAMARRYLGRYRTQPCEAGHLEVDTRLEDRDDELPRSHRRADLLLHPRRERASRGEQHDNGVKGLDLAEHLGGEVHSWLRVVLSQIDADPGDRLWSRGASPLRKRPASSD